MISVAVSISQNLIFFIQQYIIHSPGVDCHADRKLAQFFAFFHAGNDLAEQTVHIPQKLSVLMIHAILKTIDLFQLYFAVLQASQNMSSTGSTDIHGQIIFFHKISTASLI